MILCQIIRSLFSKVFVIATIILLILYGYIDNKNNAPTFTALEIDLMKESLLDERLRNHQFNINDIPSDSKENLGFLLFNDNKLSKNGDISCTSCHVPESNFHDINKISREVLNNDIKAPSLRGVHNQPWFFWDGRADSLWAQILEALKVDHGLTPKLAVSYVCNNYINDFNQTLNFCNSTSTTKEKFTKIGKVIASHVETIEHTWTRYDEFLYAKFVKKEQNSPLLSYNKIEGLKLFLSREKTGCVDCHSGKRFTNNSFFAIGTGNDANFDRLTGIQKYQTSEFKCSDWDIGANCLSSKYMRTSGPDLKGAYKVPSLRNLNNASQLMHDGRFNNLEQVLNHYMYPTGYMNDYVDVTPVRLMPHERKQLIQFIHSLNEPFIPTGK
ncbi:hypothetical protein CTM67_17975 [Photobacterium phosphoreum]|nr:hypothetical protein CTM67_17975 [Photobacterium phosphoreum]